MNRPAIQTSILCTVSALVSSLVACGNSTPNATTVDAATAAVVDASVADSATSVDAMVCATDNYPRVAGSIDLNLDAPVQLILDGSGDRCDQIVRALMSYGTRPAALAAAEQDFSLASCMFDEIINADIVRLRKSTFAGLPLYGTGQDILAHVKRETNNLSFLAGRVIPTTAAQGVPSGCWSQSQVSAKIPGTTMSYQKFEACRPLGAGNYTIADDDLISVKEQGWFVDSQDQLRRVWVAPVFLLPAHVNPEIINSSAFCCADETLINCVGSQMIFDAVTGELLSQMSNCITC
jgi:hypothetical protein